MGMTRAPGIRPRMSPVGIRNSLSPEKPTTSASICLPSAVSTRQRPPTAASQPTASSVMPTMRFSVPSTTNSAAFAMRSRACTRPSAHLWAGCALSSLTKLIPPRGAVAWRSVPSSSLKMPPRRVSRRASMREVVVVIWHPPRAMTGSSTMVQARSFSVGARCCLTTAASSGCRCTRTSRVATGSAAMASRMMPMICVGSVFSSRRTICRANAIARVSSSRSTSASSASNGLARS